MTGVYFLLTFSFFRLRSTFALIVWLSAYNSTLQSASEHHDSKIQTPIRPFTLSFSSFSLSGSMSVMQFLTLYTFLCRESTRAVNRRWEFDVRDDGMNLIFLISLPCDCRIPCTCKTDYHQMKYIFTNKGGKKPIFVRLQISNHPRRGK